MNKTFCDKCHGEVYGEGKRITQSILNSEPGKASLNYDLCNPCFKKLEAFLKRIGD